MSELKKEQWEQKVFTAFAASSNLNIDAASIRSCKPPMPDVFCSADGTNYFFELAEVVPEMLAATLNTKGMYTTGFPDPKARGPHAMVRILKQKQDKSYETDGAPVDLLLYFDRDYPLYLPEVKGDDPQQTDIDQGVEACKKYGPFTRIWKYCGWDDTTTQLA